MLKKSLDTAGEACMITDDKTGRHRQAAVCRPLLPGFAMRRRKLMENEYNKYGIRKRKHFTIY